MQYQLGASQDTSYVASPTFEQFIVFADARNLRMRRNAQTLIADAQYCDGLIINQVIKCGNKRRGFRVALKRLCKEKLFL